MTSTIRKQVLEQIIASMVAAAGKGRDPMQTAGARFPSAPIAVLDAALAEFHSREAGGRQYRLALNAPVTGGRKS